MGHNDIQAALRLTIEADQLISSLEAGRIFERLAIAYEQEDAGRTQLMLASVRGGSLIADFLFYTVGAFGVGKVLVDIDDQRQLAKRFVKRMKRTFRAMQAGAEVADSDGQALGALAEPLLTGNGTQVYFQPVGDNNNFILIGLAEAATVLDFLRRSRVEEPPSQNDDLIVDLDPLESSGALSAALLPADPEAESHDRPVPEEIEISQGAPVIAAEISPVRDPAVPGGAWPWRQGRAFRGVDGHWRVSFSGTEGYSKLSMPSGKLDELRDGRIYYFSTYGAPSPDGTVLAKSAVPYTPGEVQSATLIRMDGNWAARLVTMRGYLFAVEPDSPGGLDFDRSKEHRVIGTLKADQTGVPRIFKLLSP